MAGILAASAAAQSLRPIILSREADGAAGILRSLEPCEGDIIATIGELQVLLPPDFAADLQSHTGKYVAVMRCDDRYCKIVRG